MKSVSYYAVTWKTPIRPWNRLMNACPQIKIVLLPNLKIKTGANKPQNKFAKPKIKVPF